MSYKLKRNLGWVARITFAAAGGGSLVSAWQGYGAQGYIRPWNFGNGAVDGSIIAFLLSAYTLLLTEVALKEAFFRLSFAIQLLINTTAYVGLILFGRALGRYLMEYHRFVLFPLGTPVEQLHFTQSVGAAAIASIGLNFFLQNSRLLGPRILASFVTGRYHVPVREKRVVMFMDLASSTTIAEQIGDERFLRFLDAVFAEFTEPILETGAEIYKYVGDEIILSWPEESGLSDANCLKLFALVTAALRRRRAFFQKNFSVTPRFRAGVHLGSVVVGEMGDLKQEIVYVGDLMNTTARIAAHTRVAECDFLASSELLARLELPKDMTSEVLGRVRLRGKEQPLELASVYVRR